MRRPHFVRPVAAAVAFTLVAAGPVGADGIDRVQPADPGALAPAERGERQQLVEPPPGPRCTPGTIVRKVDTTQKVVAFSFDDGPVRATRTVMDKFERRGLRTTFFMIGIQVSLYPDIAREAVARGFEVANHSVTHSYSPTTMASEVRPANDLLERITGARPALFRSPGLKISATVQEALAREGMCNVFANDLTGDAAMPRPDAATVCARFARQLRPGSIVLAHDGANHPQTIAAIDCMLDVARVRGFEVVTVSELLTRGPAITL